MSERRFLKILIFPMKPNKRKTIKENKEIKVQKNIKRI